MALQWVSKVLQSWSARAILQRLDKRKLQHELDTHKLFLLTSYHRQGAAAAENAADELASQAEELQFEGMRAVVSSNLHSQLLSLASAMHAALQQGGDPMPAAARLVQVAQQQQQQAARHAQHAQQQVDQGSRGGRGMAMAVGSVPGAAGRGTAAAAAAAASVAQSAPAAETSTAAATAGGAPAAAAGGARAPLSTAQLAAAFREQAGFVLRVSPSSIAHAESGDGLWIEGRASVGQVVALYPGVAYSPMQYRQIPGYPKIDRGNPYFIGRFDGVVLDAKPWGQGLGGGEEEGVWPAHPLNSSEAALELVEGRNPLALGHFANHPPAGSTPNVMVAAIDFRAPGDAPQLRAYMPNVLFQEPQQERDAQQGAQPPASPSAGETVTGLALVATRELKGEELFLNYRLSPHVAPPKWYTPVDAEEDRRRWA